MEMITEKYYIVAIIWLVRRIIPKKKSTYENKDKNTLYATDDKFEACVLMFCNTLTDVTDWSIMRLPARLWSADRTNGADAEELVPPAAALWSGNPTKRGGLVSGAWVCPLTSPPMTTYWPQTSPGFWAHLKPGMAINLFNLLRTPPFSWLHIFSLITSWDFRSLFAVGGFCLEGLVAAVQGSWGDFRGSSVSVSWPACYRLPSASSPSSFLGLLFCFPIALWPLQPILLPVRLSALLLQSFFIHILEWSLISSVNLFPPCHALGSNAPPGLGGGGGGEKSQITGQSGLFNKWCWANWKAIWKELRLNPYITPYARINSKWIQGLNVKKWKHTNTVRKPGWKIQRQWKIKKFDNIKIKKLLGKKCQKSKDWKKIFAAYIIDKGLIFLVYKELKI